MKLNWGTGIAIFYSAFVLVMIFMVVKSAQNQSHLVQEHYYDKDLNYEEFRQKRENARDVKRQVSIRYEKTERRIYFDFPKDIDAATGDIALYRPSNKFLDKKFKITLDEEKRMYIPVTREIPAGLWRIQVDWEAGGRKYFQEKTMVL